MDRKRKAVARGAVAERRKSNNMVEYKIEINICTDYGKSFYAGAKVVKNGEKVVLDEFFTSNNDLYEALWNALSQKNELS